MGVESIRGTKELHRHGGMIVVVVMVLGQMKVFFDGKTFASIGKAQVPDIPILGELRPGQLEGSQKVVVVGKGSDGLGSPVGIQFFSNGFLVHGQFGTVKEGIVFENHHSRLLQFVLGWSVDLEIDQFPPQLNMTERASDFTGGHFLGHRGSNVSIPLGIDGGIPGGLNQLREFFGVGTESIDGVVLFDFVAEGMSHFLPEGLMQVELETCPTRQASGIGVK